MEKTERFARGLVASNPNPGFVLLSGDQHCEVGTPGWTNTREMFGITSVPGRGRVNQNGGGSRTCGHMAPQSGFEPTPRSNAPNSPLPAARHATPQGSRAGGDDPTRLLRRSPETSGLA